MKTALDTNAVLDLLTGTPAGKAVARAELTNAASAGVLAICPVVYAELRAGFNSASDLKAFLDALDIQLDGYSVTALNRAGEAWANYTRRRGTRLECPRCGQQFAVSCPRCQSPLAWRQHLIGDFLIAAHAVIDADQIISRDRGFFRTYFPELHVVTPGTVL